MAARPRCRNGCRHLKKKHESGTPDEVYHEVRKKYAICTQRTRFRSTNEKEEKKKVFLESKIFQMGQSVKPPPPKR